MVALALPRVRALPRARAGHPEAGAAVVVALAWVALLVRPGHHWTGPADLPQWTVMAVATMGPAALPGIRHTARNSLRWRRRRAQVEFAGAYLAVWVGYGAVVLAALPRVPVPVGVALLAAAGWQLTPYKRRVLLACHRGRPLPPTGRRADRAAAGFGLRVGVSCVGSCWALMLVMAASPPSLLWTAGLAALVTTERLTRHPVRTIRVASLLLAALAFATLAPTLT
jgi:predicted metal-binding membrane protein